MSVTELGQILAFLRKRIKSISLVHKYEVANHSDLTSINIAEGQTAGSFVFHVSRRREMRGPQHQGQNITQSVDLFFQEGDAAVLEEIFSESIRVTAFSK